MLNSSVSSRSQPNRSHSYRMRLSNDISMLSNRRHWHRRHVTYDLFTCKLSTSKFRCFSHIQDALLSMRLSLQIISKINFALNKIGEIEIQHCMQLSMLSEKPDLDLGCTAKYSNINKMNRSPTLLQAVVPTRHLLSTWTPSHCWHCKYLSCFTLQLKQP